MLLPLLITGQSITTVSTDKAMYNPGDIVHLSILLADYNSGQNISLKIYHLFELVDEKQISISNSELTTEWETPEQDYKGYLIQISLMGNNSIIDQKTIAIDVSSEWSKFPRYGFLSDYSNLSNARIEEVIENLNRFHINGIQFYDWHWKHHIPLKGTPENPSQTWLDIANRTNHFLTIEKYINAAHEKSMNVMSYNLLYGALENAEQDGVQENWYVYKDQNHTQKDEIDLSFWGHYIYVMNPASTEWKNYLFSKTENVFKALDFDGWHVDQLGDRGNLFDYLGNKVELEETFDTYLSEAKNALDKKLVMSAVNQYGYRQIASAPVEFLYTEVWNPNDTFYELANIIGTNYNISGGEKSTIVAAYINHDLAEQPGYFNTPAVLLADAVIFAFGGAHIELGEHMLGHEYFPNNNLLMTSELKEKLVQYYDFSVAYQNLLRDERSYTSIAIETDSEYEVNPWSSSTNDINVLGVNVGSKEIFHLINFVGTSTISWADNQRIQTEPLLIENLNISVTPENLPKSVWLASPDFNQCIPLEIEFNIEDDKVNLTIPQLKYWDMLVFDSEPVSTINPAENLARDFSLEQNYPNPFNPLTKIKFTVPTVETAQQFISTKLIIYDILGGEIKALIDKPMQSGEYEVEFDGSNLSSGIYFYRLIINNFAQTKKMILMK